MVKKVIFISVIVLLAVDLWTHGWGFRLFKNVQWLYGPLTDNEFQLPETECDTNLWRQVYSPERLYIVNPCVQITGVVSNIIANQDGDYHINIKPDNKYTGTVNLFNQVAWSGSLVAEIVCAHATREETCQGYENKIYLPKKGERVTVRGSLVIDTPYGWKEIHPAMFIRI